GPADDLVGRDLLVVLPAELVGIGRVQVLPLGGQCQEERVLGARRNEGFEGDVTLCLDVPDDDFERYEWVEEGGGMGYRHALLPAAVLNGFGPPKVYDCLFAGCSRRQKVQETRQQEEEGESNYPSAEQMRSIMTFFDGAGWCTPFRSRVPRGPAGPICPKS